MDGIWYAGISITKGAGSPENRCVFLRAIPESTITAIPRKYMAGARNMESGKNVDVIILMMTALAEQGINVQSIMVMRRSRSFSIVRVAITAGTPHPIPTRIGMKDFPESPKRRKILSMIKATRAIYPESSRRDIKKKIRRICGTNPRTVPTPR